ncbi:hypothetical protein Back11_24980 [Paenibacillus baekrokdamisoli]|uniref:ABC3 transporter permease C-terminal domain-containing protein n=1 Tax=Paenibacillus baekrokdamisoli TaxID=1712516 RepID=A0A3G9J8G8_9BACL|nr:ABC transporter permease [Paenibacillus baekrokdamisoli]MBB3070142.1 ABC-type lipoprotein release transport system permease subunit [Paenibacillus baekrokdamisoli]BBH21153.1 hypothetical protein Back11_24980 [Paenibacillus baekrokdamisoli]
MIASGLIWSMAWGNIKRQWRQTLLTVAAGTIGAMLIAVSVINFVSVKNSSDQWIAAHYGPIDWALTSTVSGATSLTDLEVQETVKPYLENKVPVRFLPIINSDTVVMYTLDEQGKIGHSQNGLQLIGFNSDEAIKFDAANSQLWSSGLLDNEIIVDQETASSLVIERGDTIFLSGSTGARLPFKVKEIAQENGLTGYQGIAGISTGTVIVNESTSRTLTGLTSGYHAVLAGRNDLSMPIAGFTTFPDHPIKLNLLKNDAMNKTKQLNLSLFLSMISAVAIVSSAMLMRQVLIMIAEARWELYGLLRAIGLSRGHIRSMFTAEALLLSLLSAGIGTLLGAVGGYVLVHEFYGRYSGELARMSGIHLTLTPHVTAGSLLFIFGTVTLFLGLIAVWAAGKAGRLRIMDALRGVPLGKPMKSTKRKVGFLVLSLSMAIVLAVHLSEAFIVKMDLNNDSVLLILLFWLGGCLSAVYFMLMLVSAGSGFIGGILRLLRLPNSSLLLAVKYPKQYPGRTYTIALLFALVMMVITFTACMGSVILNANDVDKTNQTAFGFGGYAGYQTIAERDKILSLIQSDEVIKSGVKAVTTVEPFMLLTSKEWSQAIIPVTQELIDGDGLQLLKRAPKFKSDKEVWKAVSNDPSFLVLPAEYADNRKGSNWASPEKEVKVGETITLPLYESKMRTMNEQWTPLAQKTFTIAGIAKRNTANKLNINFYSATYVNPAIYEELKPYGYKWPNQLELGFVLMKFNYKDVNIVQQLEDRMRIGDVLTFHAPYADNSAEQLINRQIFLGFLGFTAFSALIGLLGLAVVQFRAVRERGKAIAMMRCVGLPSRHIAWMFILEGSIIGTAGLMTGWAIGSSGAKVFIQTISQDVRSGEQPIPFDYPIEILLPVILGLLVSAVLINLGPARSALKQAPADALRASDE